MVCYNAHIVNAFNMRRSNFYRVGCLRNENVSYLLFSIAYVALFTGNIDMVNIKHLALLHNEITWNKKSISNFCSRNEKTRGNSMAN